MAFKNVLYFFVLNLLVQRFAADKVFSINDRFCKGYRTVICKGIDASNYTTLVYNYREAYNIYFQDSYLPSIPKGVVSSEIKVLKMSKVLLENITSERLNGYFLTSLDLSINNINFLPKDVFINTPKLEYLNLSYNHLQYLPESLFGNSISQRSNLLEILDVSYNELGEELVFLRSLPNLIALNLSGNCVGNPKPWTLAKNVKLTQLFLAKACLTGSFKYGSFPHKTLRELDLSDNGLKYIDYKPFITIPRLEKLYLRDKTLQLSTILGLVQTLSLAEIELAPAVYQCDVLEDVVRKMRRHKVELTVSKPEYDIENINGLQCIN